MDNSIIDEETFLFIYKNVCIFNDIEYTDEDITNPDIDGDNYKIIFYINKVVREIVIKTNRNQFPTDLKYLVTDIVNNLWFELQNENNPNSSGGAISSMSEAGRSISFDTSSSSQRKYQLLIQQQLQAQETLINKYKLLYKVGCPYAED